MKHLLISTAFLISSFAAHAQLEKGNWLVGGNANFSSSTVGYSYPSYSLKEDVTSLAISPNIGYFLLDRFAVGLSPGFSFDISDVTTPGGGYSNTRRYVIGPFVRYYFLDTEKPVNILADASYQHSFIWWRPARGNGDAFSFNAGPVVYLNSSVGLEFTIGYYSRAEEVKEQYKDKTRSFRAGIGFQIHLKK